MEKSSISGRDGGQRRSTGLQGEMRANRERSSSIEGRGTLSKRVKVQKITTRSLPRLHFAVVQCSQEPANRRAVEVSLVRSPSPDLTARVKLPAPAKMQHASCTWEHNGKTRKTKKQETLSINITIAFPSRTNLLYPPSSLGSEALWHCRLRKRPPSPR
mgnify:CR=1 FL=1